MPECSADVFTNEDLVVAVLYDYEYCDKDGQTVQIVKDEELYVISRTNHDWWQVVRSGERRPFYAPTQYLRVIDLQTSAWDDIVHRCSRASIRDVRRAPISLVDAEKHISSECLPLLTALADDSVLTPETPQSEPGSEVSLMHDHRASNSSSSDAHSASAELDRDLSRESDNGILPQRSGFRKRQQQPHVMPDLMSKIAGSLGNSEKPPLYRTRVKSRETEAGPVVGSGGLLRQYSTFSNLRSSRVDMADHNASFKLTARRMAPPVGQQKAPIPAPPVPPKHWQHHQLQPSGSCSRLSHGHQLQPSGSCSRLSHGHQLRRSAALSRSVDRLSLPLVSLGQPPIPHMLDTPLRQLKNGWAEYCDSMSSGRRFYYNADTGVSRWKPPRRCVSPPAEGGSGAARQVSVPLAPLPEGWRRRLDSSGSVCYLRSSSPTPWYHSRDDDDRIYYFREGEITSYWSLPQCEHVSPAHSPSHYQDNAEYPSTAADCCSGLTTASCETSSTSVDASPVVETVSLDDDALVEDLSRGRKLTLPVGKLCLSEDSVTPSAERRAVTEASGDGSDAGGVTPAGTLSWAHFDASGKLIILNQGTLNRTKVVNESGRRVRKHWSACHAILTESHLFLFKDTRSAAHMQCGIPGSRPECLVDLSSAAISWQPEKSSRRNVFQIATLHGIQILLQDDSSTTAQAWFDAIRLAVSRVKRSSLCLSSLLSASATIPTADPGDHRKFGRTFSIRGGRMVSSAPPETVTAVPEAPNSTSIRDLLKKFFRSRPAADALRHRGILKDEPVFGCSLASLCEAEGNMVPRFVRECVTAIESRPNFMRVVGLYRVSANLSLVQKLRCQVDQDRYAAIWDEADVHVLTGALKLFLRELREPLVSFDQLSTTLQLAEFLPGSKQCRWQLKQLFRQLPACNAQTLLFLLQHLNRVIDLYEDNRMDAHNVSTVFGPTLMWPEHQLDCLALGMMQQNRAVDNMLNTLRLMPADSHQHLLHSTSPS